MTVRRAGCRCGAVTAEARGEPVRVSICHCHDCQQRSGSAFSAQARFPKRDVTIAGETTMFETVGESGRWARFRFCPTCGDTIAYEIEYFPDLVAIPLGLMAGQAVPPPAVSVWESRKQPWVAITGDMVHD